MLSDELMPEFNEQRADAIGQNGNDGEHYALTPAYQAKVDEIETLPARCGHEFDEAVLCPMCEKIRSTASEVGAKYGEALDAMMQLDPLLGTVTSDGSTASYYELPAGSTELQHLISHRDMNAQIGEIFRACYRYGIASHSNRLRDARKIKFYIDAEIERLLKL